ncbi:hypothetical protein BDB01DRAFT_731192 [Pilobolus umbonatus]|nr:hypothetical protein BDB01DRAFT_731192 [Pilobolus umbonatus]
MGQHISSEHASLTFGYVAKTETVKGTREKPSVEDLPDHILSNPHLYQLQTVCDHCQKQELSSDEVISTAIIQENCSKCHKQKRLSLLRRDLQDDLQYIDQTYYPGLVHYSPNDVISYEDSMELELMEAEKVRSQWSKLTVADISPGITIRSRRLTSPFMPIDLSHRSLIKLTPSIGYLDILTKLNLSHNQMTEIPREIGYLKNLEQLNIAHNSIHQIPDTIAYLSKLKALNIGNNRLSSIPSYIGELRKLVIIVADANQLTHLPRELAHLTHLLSLNVSHNPLKTLPAEVASLKSLRKLLIEGCAFDAEYSYDLRHDPPSLFETCARIAVKSQIDIPNQMSEHIKNYLSRADTCSYCKGPFFDSHVKRVRLIERVVNNYMVLEHTLCCAHWSDDRDRLLAMFSDNYQVVEADTPPCRNQPNQHKKVDTNGLIEPQLLRHRAYSDSSSTTHSTLSIRKISSSLMFKRSHSSNSLKDCLPSSTPVCLLKSHPTLPHLPQHSSFSSNLSQVTLGDKRTRATSTASQ